MSLVIPEVISDYLSNQDTSLLPIEDYDQVQHLLALVKQHEDYSAEEKKGIFAEISAFEFQPSDKGVRGAWDIYWTSHMSGTNADGREFHIPEINFVDQDVLDYWVSRSREAKHSVLKARYADLAWEIGKYCNRQSKLKGEIKRKISHELPLLAIDAYLEAINKNLYIDDYSVWKVFGRAIELAVSLNDEPRIALIKVVMFSYSKTHELEKSFMWWQLDNLTLEYAKQLKITPEESEDIVLILSRALEKTSDTAFPETFDPHNALSAARRLSQRHKANGKVELARVAIKRGCFAFESAAEIATALLAISWLEDLIPIYRSENMNEEAVRIENLIRTRSGGVQAEMKSFETSIEIPKDEMEKWVKNIVGKEVNEALARIALKFLIREDSTKESVRRTTKDAPLMAMMGSSIINDDGFTVARVGSVQEDMDGRAIQHTTTLVQINSIWLFNAYQGTKEKYNLKPKDILDFLKPCGLFRDGRIPLIESGLIAWFEKDAFKCIHILVPQIEAGIRNLLADMGGSVMEADAKLGGFQAIGFGKIINNFLFQSKVDKDLRFHLKSLYSDARGINLRNDIAHGLINPEILNTTIADWVVHTLLLIGCLKVIGKN